MPQAKPKRSNRRRQSPIQVRVIGVPMDLGAGRRGVDMGPSAIRIGRLSERLRSLDIHVEEAGNISVQVAEQVPYGRRDLKYLHEIGDVCAQLATRVRETLEDAKTPLVLGGDHSIAAGSVSGASSFFHQRGKRIGLIWIDAHADMNLPETSPSGNIHGMPLASLLGMGPDELTKIEGFAPKVEVDNLTIVGARSIDREEAGIIRKAGVRVVTMKEIDMRGMTAVMEEALRRATDGTEGFHCSFDLDVVDPQAAPGVGTPVPGGITYRESHLAMEMIYDSRKCVSLEFVEVNPVLDVGNATGQLAAGLACSALGMKIL